MLICDPNITVGQTVGAGTAARASACAVPWAAVLLGRSGCHRGLVRGRYALRGFCQGEARQECRQEDGHAKDAREVHSV